MTHYNFLLSPRAHNCIVSNVRNCIIERSDRRLYIYIIEYIVKILFILQIVNCTLLSPTYIY